LNININLRGIDWVILFLFFIVPTFLLMWKIFIPLLNQYKEAKNGKILSEGMILKTGGTFGIYCSSYPFVTIKLDISSLFIRYDGCEYYLFYDKIDRINIDYGYT
jgi:hypothetical protein